MTTNATTEEILDTFATLSKEEWKGLCYAAAIHMAGTRFSDPIDLVHEALNLMLDGRRNWPAHMKFGPFMFSTMRSIADADRQSHASKFAADTCVEDMLGGAWAGAMRAPSVEDQIVAAEPGRIARQAAIEARAQLHGDEDAQLVIDGLVDGLTPQEICSALHVAPGAYQNAKKRALRKIKKILDARLH